MNNLVFAGIDVSAKTLDVCVERPNGKKLPVRQFENSAAGHKAIAGFLLRYGDQAQVVVEATGSYSLQLCLALNEAPDIELMVANPLAVRRFSAACMERSKSDVKDAQSICEFAKRMDFVPWVAPNQEVLELRTIARRIGSLSKDLTREQNRLHAEEARGSLKLVLNDIEVNLRHLERRVERMTEAALSVIHQNKELESAYRHLTSVKGIAETSAVALLGELLILPKDMNVRQWVAHAGLDPREFSSGTSVRRKVHISKVGNAHIRRALYMPALVATQHEPRVKAYYQKLQARGLAPQAALVAVMRKLLHAIHGMLRTDTDFDGNKFFHPDNELKSQSA